MGLNLYWPGWTYIYIYIYFVFTYIYFILAYIEPILALYLPILSPGWIILKPIWRLCWQYACPSIVRQPRCKFFRPGPLHGTKNYVKIMAFCSRQQKMKSIETTKSHDIFIIIILYIMRWLFGGGLIIWMINLYKF